MVWLPFGLVLDDDTDGHVDNVAAFTRPAASWPRAATTPTSRPRPPGRQPRCLRDAAGCAGRAARGDGGPGPALRRARRGAPGRALPQPLRLQRRRHRARAPATPPTTTGWAASVTPSRAVRSSPCPGAVLALGGGGPHCITQQMPIDAGASLNRATDHRRRRSRLPCQHGRRTDRAPWRVGAVQHRWHADPDQHAEALADGVATAAGAGRTLVCLQELTLSPYFAALADGPDGIDATPEDLGQRPDPRPGDADLATTHGVLVSALAVGGGPGGRPPGLEHRHLRRTRRRAAGPHPQAPHPGHRRATTRTATSPRATAGTRSSPSDGPGSGSPPAGTSGSRSWPGPTRWPAPRCWCTPPPSAPSPTTPASTPSPCGSGSSSATASPTARSWSRSTASAPSGCGRRPGHHVLRFVVHQRPLRPGPGAGAPRRTGGDRRRPGPGRPRATGWSCSRSSPPAARTPTVRSSTEASP